MQQVAYDLLLFQQRQQLHRSVAQWYERSYAANLGPHYPFLAHHWQHAGDPSKAVDYLEKAGGESLRSGGYSEAAGFLREAIALDADASLATDSFRRARWQRQLGEALLGLGRLAHSQQHLQQALRWLGRSTPDSRSALYISLLGHVARQFVRRLGLYRKRAKEIDACLDAARCYERLAEIYYLSADKARLLHALLATLNLTESIGVSPELARAYANASFAAGLLGLRRLARTYRRHALDTADTVGDPPARGWVLGAVGISCLGMGQMEEARKALDQAIALYQRLGDWQHWGVCLAMAAQAAYWSGDFHRGVDLWTQLYATAQAGRSTATGLGPQRSIRGPLENRAGRCATTGYRTPANRHRAIYREH